MVYRPYRLSHNEREFVKEQIKELKEYGLIRDSNSPYSSPILLTKKKMVQQECVLTSGV